MSVNWVTAKWRGAMQSEIEKTDEAVARISFVLLETSKRTRTIVPSWRQYAAPMKDGRGSFRVEEKKKEEDGR